jgi:hypothetical protein
MKRYFKAKIKDGKFYSNKEQFRNGVSSLPDGEYIQLLVKTSDRTLRESQNYYFVQIGEWALSTGHTKDELHDMIKKDLFVELFDSPVSTADLTEADWSLVFLNLENWLLLKFENR